MTDPERIELLAQALWLRTIGMRRLTSAWTTFAEVNTAAATQYRTKAQSMLDTAGGSTTGVGFRRPYTSLGWLI